jgi:hypothetical protein
MVDHDTAQGVGGALVYVLLMVVIVCLVRRSSSPDNDANAIATGK